MSFLGLKYPVLQAPIGSIATTNLIAAVSNAGGMGSLALTWTAPDKAVKQIKRLKTKTSKLFFVNYVLSFPPKTLDAVLDAGVPAVTCSWCQKLVTHKSGAVINRYDDDPPLSTMKGEILDCCLYAGTGSGAISDIPNAGNLLADIWAEYKAL